MIMMLDGEPRFQASAVTDLVARDNLAYVTLPVYSPELNPVEECWIQLESLLSSQFFDSLNELTTTVHITLE